MGMAASQLNFVFLSNRLSSVQLSLIAAGTKKEDITAKTDEIDNEINELKKQKVYQWTQNSGISSVPLTYDLLMNSTSVNQGNPYLVTDLSGKFVMDSNLKQYAEMISPDGSPVGSARWEAIRDDVLSAITGVDADTIREIADLQSLTYQYDYEMQSLELEKPRMPVTSDYTTLTTITGINQRWDWNSATSDWIAAVEDMRDTYLSYLREEDRQKWVQTCNDFITNHSAIGTFDGDGKAPNMRTLSDALFLTYHDKNPDGVEYKPEDDVYRPKWIDESDPAYERYQQWEEQYTLAVTNYNTAMERLKTILPQETVNKISHYEKIFSAVAEKGWVYNPNVNKPDYLSQMFLNNMYTLTNLDRNYATEGGNTIIKNTYTNSIAANCSKLVAVRDEDASAEAISELKKQRNVLDRKEKYLDNFMERKKTEQDSIKTEIDNLKSKVSDSMKSAFNIFA